MGSKMSSKTFALCSIMSLSAGMSIAEAPQVAVDIAPVHSLVARVMEGVGTPDLIIPAGASPHEYNLRPSEAASLQNADVVFWVSASLTPWMKNAIETLSRWRRSSCLAIARQRCGMVERYCTNAVQSGPR